MPQGRPRPVMIAAAAWIVLHSGESHGNEGLVSFEAALGGVVATLVLVGVLWYAGVFESMGSDGEAAGDVGD